MPNHAIKPIEQTRELVFDGAAFSDGKLLAWVIGSKLKPALIDEFSGYSEKPLTRMHRSAPFSGATLPDKSITIDLMIDPIGEIIVTSPVTAGSIIDAVSAFASHNLSRSDYAMIKVCGELDRWSAHVVGPSPCISRFARKVKTVGDLLGDRRVFAGLEPMRKCGRHRLVLDM